MSITPRTWHRMTQLVIGVAVGAALVTGTVSPAAAESPASPPPAGSASLGAFGLVGGLSGAFSERDGGFGLEVPAGGLRLLWDSRASGVDRYGLGYGWSWPVSHVQTEGGVRVFPASGGVFEADSTHPTGLASYGDRDLVFEQRAGTLPGRAGGLAVEYAFVLRELGGEVTYFRADGDPVVTVTASGRRTDWRWGALGAHRLEAVIDHDEVITTIDRSGRAGGLEIERGSNLPAEPGQAPPVWFVETDGSAVRSVTGPMGDPLRFAYDGEAQVITSIHAPSGGETRLEWRALDDGTTRIARVSTLMAGEALATRTWSGDVAAPGAWAESAGFTTTVTDGDASVISAYEASGLLTNRTIVVATPAGAQVTRDERLTYPAVGHPVDASAPASARTRPSGTETVFHDSSGATRTETTSFAYDEFGRTVAAVDASGRVTQTAYDSARTDGQNASTVTGPDGVSVTTETDALGRVTRIADDVRDGEPTAGHVRVIETRDYAEPGVVRVTDAWGAQTTTRTDVHGREVAVTDGSGVTKVTRYDDVANTVTTGVSATGDLDDAEQTTTSRVDAGGRVTDERTDRVDGAPGTATETVYDGAGRQIASNDGLIDLRIETDDRGNAATTTLIPVLRTDGSADPPALVAEKRFDGFGTPLEAVDGTRTAYDAANRPVLETAADGTETSFGYWADGTRRERASGADATTFYWDGPTMVNDLHADPVTGAELGAASYMIGMARHARTVATPDGALDTRYAGTDRHGNVTDLTAPAGELVERYEYSDYGVQRRLPAGAEPADELHRMPFGYSGEYTDPSGRQHLAARTYEPATMRFTAADTAKLHNLYAYADLNPITKIDPTGHDAAEDVMRFWLPEVVVPILVGLALSFSIAGAVMTPYLQAAHITGLLMQAGAVGGVIFHEVNTRLLPTPLVDPAVSGGIALGVAGAAFIGGIASGLIGEAVRALPRLARRIASNVNWARYRLQRMMTRQGTTTVVDPPPVVQAPIGAERTAAQAAFDGPPGGVLTEVSYSFTNPELTRSGFMRSLLEKFDIDPSEVAAEIRIIKNART